MSDALRAMAARHLTTPCTVTRPVNASDGAGGTTQTFTVLEHSYCRIEVINSTGGVNDSIPQRVGSRQDYRYSLPTDSVAKRGDLIDTADAMYEILTAPRSTNAVLINGTCAEV